MPRPSPSSTQRFTSTSAWAMKFAIPLICFLISAVARGLSWPSTTAGWPSRAIPTRESTNAATSFARAVTSAFCCWVK